MKIEIERQTGGPWILAALAGMVVVGLGVRDGGFAMWLTMGALAALLLSFRRYLFADREEGRLYRSWGFLRPLVHEPRALPALDQVDIRGEDRWVRNGNRQIRVHLMVVRLQGSDGQGVEAGVLESPDAARRLGEALAKAYRLPLHDRSDPANVATRLPEHLDESVQARLRRLGTEVRPPSGPAPRHCTSERRGRETVLEFPARGFGAFPFSYLAAAIASTAVMAAGFHYVLLPLATTISLVVGAVVLLAMGALGLDACTYRERVTVSARSLVLERSSALRRSRLETPMKELEDLTVSGTRRTAALGRTGGWSVRATSDRAVVEFGATPSLDDAHWVKDTVLGVLAGG